MRGSPETCVARSSSVICLPFRAGMWTDLGRNFATGSSSFTSPRATMSASSDAVKTFVMDPISNTRSAATPTATTRLPPASSRPTTMPLSWLTRGARIAWTAESDGSACCVTHATLLAGFILVAFGLLRLGGAIKFIPYPVTIGFTSGIALIIFSSQIRDLLGLDMQSVPSAFLPKWDAYARAFDSVNPWALVIAVAALAIIVVWPKISTRIPGPFVALIVTTVLAQLLHLPVETIGARFGAIHAGLPHPGIPHLSLPIIQSLAGPAFTIALLAAIESLLSAVVADGMIGGRHRSNMELVAQGVANIASPLFGGMPATGAIARTATNVKNGGRTPVAGMIHAITLLLITLFFGRWAGLIPLATLAAILVVVAFHMSEWRTFIAEFRAPKSDVAVLLTTFLLTVL